MLIRIPRPHRRLVKSLEVISDANRWASDVDLRILEILRSLEDVQRVINNITVTNAPATFITSACSQRLGADTGCFRNVALSNHTTLGALLTASPTFTVGALSLYPPLGPAALTIDATAVRRASSDFFASTFAKGFVMTDSQATVHYWRLRMSSDGIPFCTDIGATVP